MGSLLLSTSPLLISCNSSIIHSKDDLLLNTSYIVLKEWCDALLKYQITDKSQKGLYGGLLCPSCSRIHGRCSDAVYPLMYLAKTTGDNKYLNTSIILYNWMEENVSLPDGAWINDVNVSDWVGTTVFTAIALGEALTNHGDLLDNVTRNKWLARLKRAADYIDEHFHIDYSNINYPISASYALSLFGDLFDEQRYKLHAKKLAHQALDFITDKDKLLFGEGEGGHDDKSFKGCYPVDLGYNVEESLPALVLYGLGNKDTKVLEVVKKSLEAHMEFMLPDGGWDNSWGTRNFKWTYWGSRTSDGCQTAYALMADKNPQFYKVAYQNLLLLKNCTSEGLLHGGPHYDTHGVFPCIHHTFCHTKALATILDHGLPIEFEQISTDLKLPREKAYGVKKMNDIQTWLVSNENWKATVTGYDKEYSFKNGHPSGGALSMLWHKNIGPVLTSSMNEYRLIEAPNMQQNYDPNSMTLTARLQTMDGKFMNISDLTASVNYKVANGNVVFEVNSKLVDAEQNSPEKGTINCKFSYIFNDNSVTIKVYHDFPNHDEIQFVLPIISSRNEKYQLVSEKNMTIHKGGNILNISTNKALKILPVMPGKKRIFNFVPGMEAIPLAISGNEIELKLEV